MFKHVLACLCLVLSLTDPAQAQLNKTFNDLFNDVLVDALALSPENHGQHFLIAADEADHQLTPGLNSLIASNISSFPLSTTVASVTFDFSTGQPVPIMGSQGPIFAENAETLGERKFVIGFNATHLNLNTIRGIPLDEMRFTFLHEDVDNSGVLGDNVNESDLIDIYPHLNAEANIFAIFGTFGVAPNLDVSIAIPFVDVSLDGNSEAVVESFTLGALAQANHHFGDDAVHPTLSRTEPYTASAAGIGDIALRFKWRLPVKSPVATALLLDVRVPSGDETNFLGTGSVSARGVVLLSKTFGDFTPHINVGYDYRDADLDSDEVEAVIGFDQKIVDGVTFALDFLGEFDVQKSEAIRLLPGSVTIHEQVPDTDAQVERTVTRSNIPNKNYDNTINASAGFKIAPTPRFQLLGNLLIPLQDGGLRSSIAPTVGFVLSF